MITMLLGGLWHGASFKFIVWGGMHGLALAIDKAKNEWLQKIGFTGHQNFWYRAGGWIVTFHLVAFCWIFFRASGFDSAVSMINQITHSFNAEILPQLITGYPTVFLLFAIGMLMHFVPQHIESKIRTGITVSPALLQALLLAITIYAVYQIRSAEVLPFIYFQF
jgi:D-alanyl-lipoteichoic acid acyltransferase DltB (MBOAT superfamily)